MPIMSARLSRPVQPFEEQPSTDAALWERLGKNMHTIAQQGRKHHDKVVKLESVTYDNRRETQLTHQDRPARLDWEEVHQRAFDDIKEAISAATSVRKRS